MHRLILCSFGLLLLLAGAACESEGSSPKDSTTAKDTAGDAGAPQLTAVSPAELDGELAAKDFLLINVHVPYEGYIEGTDTHITYEDPDAIAAYIGSDLGRKTVVYCKSSHMATIAGEALVERGYTAIRYLEGGMLAWQAAGYSLLQ